MYETLILIGLVLFIFFLGILQGPKPPGLPVPRPLAGRPAKPIRPQDLPAVKLIEALGLSMNCRRIRIDFEPDAVVTVYVERPMTEDEAKAFASLIEKYQLRAVKTDESQV